MGFQAYEIYKELSQTRPHLVRILIEIAKLHRKFAHVPIDELSKKIKNVNLDSALHFLVKKKLIKRISQPYVGVYLTPHGNDFLALHWFVRKNYIIAIGDPIGIGKESEVYWCLTPNQEEVALKIHKAGILPFKSGKRYRIYLNTKDKIPDLAESKLAARREAEALKKIKGIVNAPKPIAQYRHFLLMEGIAGVDLVKVKGLNHDDARYLYEIIIENVEKSVKQCHVIHGDLSEFNIILNEEDGNPIIIDWPQWVSNEHPSAWFLLERDLFNICAYFAQKHDVNTLSSKEIREWIESDLLKKPRPSEQARDEFVFEKMLEEMEDTDLDRPFIVEKFDEKSNIDDEMF